MDEQLAKQTFLLEHSGQPKRAKQCAKHPALVSMTYAQIRDAMAAHGLTPMSRWWLFQLCDELNVPRRGRRGPPATTDARVPGSEGQKRRQKDYYERLKADPVRWAARQKRMKASRKGRKIRG